MTTSITTIRKFAYAALLAVTSLSFVPSPASAQENARGTFTLTHDVRWQNAMVPAGEYRFSLDADGPASMLVLTKLSGERVYYGDLQHIDKKKKEIKIIGDGACPPSLASELGPAGFAEHGIPTEGDAGGLSVKLVCKAGEGVLARLGRVNGEFRMVITRATVFEPSREELDRRLDECGIPFWPHGFVTAHCDTEALLQNWTNEYACLGYGRDLYPALAEFCGLTGITPILL